MTGGCKNFKHDVLKGHEKSEGHKIAQSELDRKMGFIGASAAEKCIELMNKVTFDKLDKLFRCAHAVAKNSRPFTDFKWINDLSEKQGVVLGQTYRTDKHLLTQWQLWNIKKLSNYIRMQILHLSLQMVVQMFL